MPEALGYFSTDMYSLCVLWEKIESFFPLFLPSLFNAFVWVDLFDTLWGDPKSLTVPGGSSQYLHVDPPGTG